MNWKELLELFMMIIIALTLNFEWPRMNVLFISKISMFSWNLKVWKRSISPVNWSVSSLQSKLYPKAFPKNNLYQKSSVKVDLGTIFHCAPQLWNFCLTDIKDIYLSQYSRRNLSHGTATNVHAGCAKHITILCFA